MGAVFSLLKAIGEFGLPSLQRVSNSHPESAGAVAGNEVAILLAPQYCCTFAGFQASL